QVLMPAATPFAARADPAPQPAMPGLIYRPAAQAVDAAPASPRPVGSAPLAPPSLAGSAAAPLLAAEPAAVRPDRPAPNGAKAADRAGAAPSPPQIDIHIGVIEVISAPAVPAPPVAAPAPDRGISLHAYLDGTGSR
ncbi:MAG: hypothetical protein WAT09_18235, partial [Paracoccaceae bacterium]